MSFVAPLIVTHIVSNCMVNAFQISLKENIFDLFLIFPYFVKCMKYVEMIV